MIERPIELSVIGSRCSVCRRPLNADSFLEKNPPYPRAFCMVCALRIHAASPDQSWDRVSDDVLKPLYQEAEAEIDAALAVYRASK